MIKFSLHCEKDHVFEAWFRSSSDFETQKQKKILTCPVCDSANVEKSLMAPNVGVKGNRKTSNAPPASVPVVPEPSAIEAAATGLPTEIQEHVVKLAREIREHVTKNADNVGEKFAEEARKIHYEETEPRGIYGKATPDEAKALHDEGIDVHALPVLPEDRN